MRIRSILPNFYRSEDVGDMDWDTRFIFIGLWSYVDDNGVGRDVEKLIIADLFPFDDARETVARVSRGLQTLCDGGQIVRYTVDGKHLLFVVQWDTYQRVDRPAKSRYERPTCEDAVLGTPDATPSRRSRDTFATGEGEKGRRGEGEKNTSSSEIADAIPDPAVIHAPIVPTQRVTTTEERPDVEALCELMADLVEGNGAKRPTISKKWRDAARLLMDRDGYAAAQVEWVARWAAGDSFWQSNVLSMPTLREKFEQLKLTSMRDRAPASGGRPAPMDRLAATVALGAQMQAEADRAQIESR